jgi:hypothetical protein
MYKTVHTHSEEFLRQYYLFWYFLWVYFGNIIISMRYLYWGIIITPTRQKISVYATLQIIFQVSAHHMSISRSKILNFTIFE